MDDIKQLDCRVYPMSARSSFPERVSAGAQKTIAVCISGGAARSFSASIGQVKGLMDLFVSERSVWGEVDALSCLSGSAWFAALLYYANASYSDDVLLGRVTTAAPESLTWDMLNRIDRDFIGYPLTRMTNRNMVGNALDQVLLRHTEINRFFSRVLGKILLAPFGADAPEKYLAWKESDVSDIVTRNASLYRSDFQTSRPDRPFLIASSSAVHIQTTRKKMYHFEYTPLYCGTAQTVEAAQLGGGYAQNIGFNSTMMSDVSENNEVAVAPAMNRFALSDLMGSSGAAPGIVFDKLGIPWIMPEFEYWPAYAKNRRAARRLSFVDGGDLEDTAIVPLLMRRYPFIIAFVNSAYPLGAKNRQCVNGINGNISRLFGLPPKGRILNNQETQIFENNAGELGILIDALTAAKGRGEIPHHVGTYRIIENNTFGVPVYEPRILWLYNDMNSNWYDRLDNSVKDLMKNRHFRYHLSDFPNFKTLFQNCLTAFAFTPPQIQLLANMWYQSVRSAPVSNIIADYLSENS